MQREKRGFTLIELLVVVLIIGILAAVAVPKYQKTVEKSKIAEARMNLSTMYKAFELCKLENGANCESQFLENYTLIDIGGTYNSSNGNSGNCGGRYGDCIKTSDWIYHMYVSSYGELQAIRSNGKYYLYMHYRNGDTYISNPPLKCKNESNSTECNDVCGGDNCILN